VSIHTGVCVNSTRVVCMPIHPAGMREYSRMGVQPMGENMKFLKSVFFFSLGDQPANPVASGGLQSTDLGISALALPSCSMVSDGFCMVFGGF